MLLGVVRLFVALFVELDMTDLALLVLLVCSLLCAFNKAELELISSMAELTTDDVLPPTTMLCEMLVLALVDMDALFPLPLVVLAVAFAEFSLL